MSETIPPRPDQPLTDRLHAPRSSWSWWEAVGVYLLASLVLGTLVALPMFAVIHPQRVANVVASAAIAVVNIAVLLLWLSRRHPGWASAIGFPSDPWPEVRVGVGVGVPLYPAVVAVGVVIALVLEEVSGRAVTTPHQIPSHLPPVALVITILYALAIAPVHEELFFRGILFRSLRDRYGFAVGAAFSAAAFGLVHYVPGARFLNNLGLMLTMVFTGLALAYLYERRGNIVASMIAHATFNTIGIVVILAFR